MVKESVLPNWKLATWEISLLPWLNVLFCFPLSCCVLIRPLISFCRCLRPFCVLCSSLVCLLPFPPPPPLFFKGGGWGYLFWSHLERRIYPYDSFLGFPLPQAVIPSSPSSCLTLRCIISLVEFNAPLRSSPTICSVARTRITPWKTTHK